MISLFHHMWHGRLGRTKTAKHRIKLLEQSTRPVHLQLIAQDRGLSNLRQSTVERNKMLNKNMIEPAKTEWPSFIVFPPKKDGLLQFCADYQK